MPEERNDDWKAVAGVADEAKSLVGKEAQQVLPGRGGPCQCANQCLSESRREPCKHLAQIALEAVLRAMAHLLVPRATHSTPGDTVPCVRGCAAPASGGGCLATLKRFAILRKEQPPAKRARKDEPRPTQHNRASGSEQFLYEGKTYAVQQNPRELQEFVETE